MGLGHRDPPRSPAGDIWTQTPRLFRGDVFAPDAGRRCRYVSDPTCRRLARGSPLHPSTPPPLHRVRAWREWGQERRKEGGTLEVKMGEEVGAE